jgi:cobalt-zinc-cadmium resistance protein CzcA
VPSTSVIIVENCVRRLAHRQQELGRQLTLTERLQEVFIGCKQVRTATVFGEAIIITVYIPILFLTGIEGKMFYPMAMTVIFALMGAFVLSLTFIPAMVAICLTGRIKEKENILIRWSKQAYEPVLRLAVRLRYGVVALAVVIFAGSLWLFSTLGQEFIPQLDEQDIAMHAMRIPSTSLTQSTQMQFDVEKVISAQPEVAFVYSKTGTAEMAADPMPPSVSDTFVIFKPQDQWRSPAELDRLIRELEAQAEKNASHHDHHGHDEHGHGDHGHGPAVDLSTHKGKVIRLLQLLLAELPGNNYEFTQPIQMRFNELIAGVRSDIAVKVYGEDFDAMTASASDIARILQSIPGASDVKVEQTQGLPVMNININREAIARLGLSVADVQEVIAIAIGGRQAGQVYQGDRRFDLVVRMPDKLRRDLTALRNLPVPLPAYQPHGMQSHLDPLGQTSHLTPGHENSRPGFIPLGAIATLEVSEGMNQISRENGKRRVVVQLNVRGRDIGSFVAEAQRKIDQQVTLPSGQWIDWGGQFENMITARQRLSIVVPICFFLIFLLLFSTFGTLRHALIVFTSVPLALTGGIISLWLRDMPFSISAAVGFIALSGVAVLNGLVMITFINQLRKDGLPLEQAIVQGALTRLRPVLMTALVASFGFLPMALARGTGAEVQRPVATVVVGGLVTCTLLTLLVLPALYAIFDGRRKEASTSQV